jgi:hypothetical protein
MRLVAAISLIGLPTAGVAVRYREYRKFLAGALFVSSGMQLYFDLARSRSSTGRRWSTSTLSAVRSTIHFLSFLSICISGGSSAGDHWLRPTPGQYRRSCQPIHATRSQ